MQEFRAMLGMVKRSIDHGGTAGTIKLRAGRHRCYSIPPLDYEDRQEMKVTEVLA